MQEKGKDNDQTLSTREEQPATLRIVKSEVLKRRINIVRFKEKEMEREMEIVDLMEDERNVSDTCSMVSTYSEGGRSAKKRKAEGRLTMDFETER